MVFHIADSTADSFMHCNCRNKDVRGKQLGGQHISRLYRTGNDVLTTKRVFRKNRVRDGNFDRHDDAIM